MKRKKEQKEKPEFEQELDDPVVEEQEILPEEKVVTGLEDSESSLEGIAEVEDLSPVELVAELEKSLEEMDSKAEEYLDGWQRSRAEFANYKKRILRENTEIRQIARGEVIRIYLDIVDDLERALQKKPQTGEGETWAVGIEIIFHKLVGRLESEGVRPMNALGNEFDPNIHEALMKEESEEFESGQIIEVVQEGYWIGDKVLRPAIVRVVA